jgi:hypothetical protein
MERGGKCGQNEYRVNGILIKGLGDIKKMVKRWDKVVGRLKTRIVG